MLKYAFIILVQMHLDTDTDVRTRACERARAHTNTLYEKIRNVIVPELKSHHPSFSHKMSLPCVVSVNIFRVISCDYLSTLTPQIYDFNQNSISAFLSPHFTDGMTKWNRTF